MIANVLYDCYAFGDASTVFDPDDLDKDTKLLILHGGEDISPSIYNETPIVRSGPAQPSKRDLIEMAITQRAWELQIPVLAICRGAQLVCAMQGGSLYQDVPCHAGNIHLLNLADGSDRVVKSNSFHHQMMIPDEGGELLAWCGPYNENRSRNGKVIKEHIKEPEIVYWKDTRTLAVQGHPEWDQTKNGIYTYTCDLINKLFGV